MIPTQTEILNDVTSLLEDLARDWDYSQALGPETLLFSQLGLESLEAVVLFTAIQEKYGKEMPFARLLADVGQRDVRDLSIGEVVEFVNSHLATVSGEGF